jgi:hypothetical protein
VLGQRGDEAGHARRGRSSSAATRPAMPGEAAWAPARRGLAGEAARRPSAAGARRRARRAAVRRPEAACSCVLVARRCSEARPARRPVGLVQQEPVGERGVQLSGGQKQRARAAVRRRQDAS